MPWLATLMALGIFAQLFEILLIRSLSLGVVVVPTIVALASDKTPCFLLITSSNKRL